MEIVKKINITKSGGTASKSAVTYRLILPVEMVKLLGITPEDRSVELKMVGDMLTVRKHKEEK